mmetsp:Transcript_13073/g.36779  ORF Transcript_13073/g.36779 Transcript_13073/m.36779 type:complete len:229 (+) Transcript_13073:1030-1716(+)
MESIANPVRRWPWQHRLDSLQQRRWDGSLHAVGRAAVGCALLCCCSPTSKEGYQRVGFFCGCRAAPGFGPPNMQEGQQEEEGGEGEGDTVPCRAAGDRRLSTVGPRSHGRTTFRLEHRLERRHGCLFTSSRAGALPAGFLAKGLAPLAAFKLIQVCSIVLFVCQLGMSDGSRRTWCGDRGCEGVDGWTWAQMVRKYTGNIPLITSRETSIVHLRVVVAVLPSVAGSND